jgi:hypothetical protein
LVVRVGMSKKPPKNFNAFVKSLELVLELGWFEMDHHISSWPT